MLAAGTPQQVAEAVEAAQPYKEQLSERGVLLIPLPIYAADEGDSAPESLPLTAEDLRCAGTGRVGARRWRGPHASLPDPSHNKRDLDTGEVGPSAYLLLPAQSVF